MCSLSCSEGGAIVVKSSRVSSGFAQTLYNPQCFLQFSESQVAPIEWANYNVSEPNDYRMLTDMAKIVRLVIPKWAIRYKVSASHTELCPFLASPQVSLVFRGNRAIFAPVMYISSLDACSWFNNSGLYFNTNITETWSFMSAEWVTLSFTLFSYSQSLSHSLSLLFFLFSSPFFLPHILILPFLLSFFLNSFHKHSTYSTQAKLHFGKWITNLSSSRSSDWSPNWSPWALHPDWCERSQDRHTTSILSTVPGKEQHRWQHGGGEYRQQYMWCIWR